MNNNYEKLFQKLEQIEPSEQLRSRIMSSIRLEARRFARIRLAFFGTAAMVSLAGMIPSFQYAAREFYQSGFYEYLSLLFSDSGAVISSWKTFAFSLAETMPLAELTIFLAIALVFLISAGLAIKNINIFQSRLKINY